ncbi:MAG: VOC family protein [Oceanococcus sp.]
MPKLIGIDHVHIYVSDRPKAAAWFEKILGMRVVESLLGWAVGGGPLTIADTSGQVHFALFEKADCTPSTAIALGADATNFLKWKALFEEEGILVRCTDHDLAWSLYFQDPFGNMYEVTTYDHVSVRAAIGGVDASGG